MGTRTDREAVPAGRVVGVVVPTVLTAAVGSGSMLALVLTGSVAIGGLGGTGLGGGMTGALPSVQAPPHVSAPSSRSTGSSRPTPGTGAPDGADGPAVVPVTFARPPAPATTPEPRPRPTGVTPPVPGPPTTARDDEPTGGVSA
ncbi:MAG: hypothetical protein ACKVZ6_06830, partial [Kineosporiaceae bacterium]